MTFDEHKTTEEEERGEGEISCGLEAGQLRNASDASDSAKESRGQLTSKHPQVNGDKVLQSIHNVVCLSLRDQNLFRPHESLLMLLQTGPMQKFLFFNIFYRSVHAVLVV